MYQLTNEPKMIYNKDTGQWIPVCKANGHYKQYLKWSKIKGNKILPKSE